MNRHFYYINIKPFILKEAVRSANKKEDAPMSAQNTPAFQVTDLYEAAYLVLSGCSLERVTCIPISKTLSCRFDFSGENIEELLEQFRSRKAVVNLFSFRTSYSQINSYVHEAKKSYEREMRKSRPEEEA
jgi:hypothetical protein